MDTYIVFWLAATVVFVLVELMTVGLTSIWFAAGSFVAFIIALLGGNVVVQGIAFILVSVVLLALTKPWAGKYINSRTVKTNVDSLVGERAVLTEDADSMKQTGKAVVNGQEWTVRPQDETQVIRKGGLTGNGRINSTCSVTRNRTYSTGKLHKNRATGTCNGN